MARAIRPGINERTWTILGDITSIPGIEDLVALDRGLKRHSKRFISLRKQRIKKISQMTIPEQCEYYRSLGYFNAKILNKVRKNPSL